MSTESSPSSSRPAHRPAHRPRESPHPSADERDRDHKAAAERIKNQGTWVDLQIQQAMARGDFDDLPGYGKPIEGLDREHDPDWWVKQLIEREQVTGVLPPALQLRKDDAVLDSRLDAFASEREVREAVTDFNQSVRRALYTTWGDPPVVTSQRDVGEEVARWRERYELRAASRRQDPPVADLPRRRWLRRNR